MKTKSEFDTRPLGRTVGALIDDAIVDIQYGLRRLLRKPALAFTVIATIALGVGISISVFALVDSLLIKEPPYVNSGRLILLGRVPASEFQKSPAVFGDWKSASSLMDDAAMYAVGGGILNRDGGPERLRVANVTANFFNVLGVSPIVGRLFLPEEESFGRNRVAVISERLWRRQFPSETSANGVAFTLNGETFVLVGVVPDGCDFPVGVDIWTPTVYEGAVLFRSQALVRRQGARAGGNCG